MGMQVELFKALRSVKIGDQEATTVVTELESHIAMKITEANKDLVAQLTSVQTSVQKDISQIKWFFSTAIVIGSIIIAITNALN